MEDLTKVPVKKVTQDTANKQEYKINIVKDYDGAVDTWYLSQKDPNYEYRFLRDEHKNLSIKTGNLLFAKGGWQLCQRDHLLRIGFKEEELSPDGLLRRGDTILAFMPKDLFKEKRAHKDKLAAEPMKAIKRMVEKGDATKGGGIHESMKGLQTKEQLKFK